MHSNQRAPAKRIALLALLVLSGAPEVDAAATGGTRLADLPQNWRGDDGRPVTLARLAGRRVFLTMAYTSCHRVCPTTMSRLAALELKLAARGEQADFVVIGYDPERDDAMAWHQYRITHRLNGANWYFLSGSRDSTDRLARALGFEFWKYDDHVIHDSRVLVFDAGGALDLALGAGSADGITAF